MSHFDFGKNSCGDDFCAASSQGISQCIIGQIATPAGVWYHAAIVYKGKLMSIYVNGSLSASVTASQTNSSTLNAMRTANYFGIERDGLSQVQNIMLDEIKLYNVALTQSQIQLDMNTVGFPATGVCDSTGNDDLNIK
jgi:hypothetical protein